MEGLSVHVKGLCSMAAFTAVFGSFLSGSPLWPVLMVA